MQTVRNKCSEYVKYGMFSREKQGKAFVYSLSSNDITLSPELLDAVKFFQGTSPFGEIGSFILDNENRNNDLFAFKHHYIAHTLEDGILLDLLSAIRKNRPVSVTSQSVKTGRTVKTYVLPLKVFVSTATGRRFICVYSLKGNRFSTIRLDYIKSVVIDKESSCTPEFALKMKEKLSNNLDNVWGVSFGGVSRSETICMKLHIDEKREKYIIDRVNREGQGGEVQKLDKNTFLFTKQFSDEWNLLNKKEDTYYSKLSGIPNRPLTMLEKSWLKAILGDPRILLFINEDMQNKLNTDLFNVQPLFDQSDFHRYDRHLDGDKFDDSDYIYRFKLILNAIKEKEIVIIEYDSGKGSRSRRQYHPYKLCYSARDNKFRLQCAAFNKRQNRLQKITLNLARITDVFLLKDQFDIARDLDELFREPVHTDPVVLEITTERNALERCMFQFASFERQTEYDWERGIYTCRIWYDPADEMELLIRILSFGLVVKVIGPDKFFKQVKERIQR